MAAKTTLVYSLDVNEFRQRVDVCSTTVSDDVDDTELRNRSKIYVDCNVTECTSSRAPAPNIDEDKPHSAVYDGSASIVRLFEWPWADVGAECARLAQEGWTAVEISPPAAYPASDAARRYPPNAWPERMLPSDLDNLTTPSGTADELHAAVATCIDAQVSPAPTHLYTSAYLSPQPTSPHLASHRLTTDARRCRCTPRWR